MTRSKHGVADRRFSKPGGAVEEALKVRAGTGGAVQVRGQLVRWRRLGGRHRWGRRRPWASGARAPSSSASSRVCAAAASLASPLRPGCSPEPPPPSRWRSASQEPCHLDGAVTPLEPRAGESCSPEPPPPSHWRSASQKPRHLDGPSCHRSPRAVESAPLAAGPPVHGPTGAPHERVKETAAT